MKNNTTPEMAAKVIKTLLKQNDLKLLDLAKQLGESPSKLSLAIRCTNGVTPKSIEMRKKIAKFFDLDPYEVWDAVFLTPKERKKGVTRKLKRRFEYSEKEWSELLPNDKVRSILAEFDMTIRDLSSILEIPYSSVTAAIYGNYNSPAREQIAEYLKMPVELLWPDLHHIPPEKVNLEALLRKRPDLRTLYGFGNMRQPFDPRPDGWASPVTNHGHT
ncbi:helix-turn-helix transcriptional regulator [uncultured Ruegeria sp.]|uniref:helix-turn-helix domain-containing protein n=1 Tax=uncultured Ruegeria sp. TaxID=259304 RepID=UPI00260DFE6D|nr:helix-turn-helix transcriptional regulator [uncultured Ruegeria sp.]